MAKRGILVNIDPGNTPLVFIVPGKEVTHEQEEKLERLIELCFSTEFEFVDVHEVGSLKELHDMVIEDHGEPGQTYPSFDDPVTEEDSAKLMGLSVTGYRLYLDRQREAEGYTVLPDEERQPGKFTDFGHHHLNLSGCHTGRMSMQDGRLSNLPKSVSPTARWDYEKPAFTELSKEAVKESLLKKLQDPQIPMMDFSNLERRVIAAMLKGNFLGVYGDFVFQDGGSARWSSKTPNLQELPRPDKMTTPNGSALKVDWEQCAPGCMGWLHMNDPYEIEECDECGRFTVNTGTGPDCDTLQDAAVKAHRVECGCTWPEFDVQDAAMSWLDNVSEGSPDGLTEADFKELESLLNVRGAQFRDNVTPAIYVCSRLAEKTKEGPNHINLLGLMKLLKETQEKIHNEELKIKDFGSPPGAEGPEEG